MKQPLIDGTYLAQLTPTGTAAIATLALRGPKVWEVLQEVFQPIGKGDAATLFIHLQEHGNSGDFWLGKVGPTSEKGDDVVLTLKDKEPLPWVEIHCHGGQQVVALLEEVLSSRGVEVCSWPQFLRWTTGNSLQVTALEEIGKATTVRTANILLDQYNGAFGQAIVSLKNALKEKRWSHVQKELQELIRWISLGRHLTTPWKVAIAGAPNVGKSSLINCLAGYKRSVVSPTPGTTRDLVSTRIALDGWPIELIDTAGFREGSEQLEQQGIDLALQVAQEADLCLWLLDASAPPVRPRLDCPTLQFVINKIDLSPAWNLEEVPEAWRISVETQQGLEELCQSLCQRLAPEVPPQRQAVPFTAALADQIQGIWEQVENENYGEVLLRINTLW